MSLRFCGSSWKFLTVMLAVLSCASTAFAAEEKRERPRLLVMDFSAQNIDKNQAGAMTDAVVQALASRSLFEVISVRDIQTLLSAERQKKLLGICEDKPQECSNELASVGASRFVLSGQLAQLGGAVQLTLQMVDTKKGQPVGRSTHIAGDIESLRKIIPYAAAEATGTPLPPPPSKVVPLVLTSVGGAALLAAGVVSLQAFAKQQVLNDELCPGGIESDGRCNGVALRDRAFYIQQQGALTSQKFLSLGLGIGGAAVAGLGLYLWPKDTYASAFAINFLPQSNGIAIAGSW